MSGFSAARSKATCGRKYHTRRDSTQTAVASVKAAAEAALEKRGLTRKGRVSPHESMANAILYRPYRGGGFS